MKYEESAQIVLDLLDDKTVEAISPCVQGKLRTHMIPLALEDRLADMLIDAGVPSYDVQVGYHALSVLAERKIGETQATEVW